MDEAPTRPAGLTAVCVLSIILGSLGALSGLVGIGSLLLQDKIAQFQQAFQPQDTRNQEEAAKFQAMNKAITDATNRYAPVQWSVLPLNILLSIGLLVGGILAIRRREPGRRFLTAACLGSIPVDLAMAIVGALVQVAIFEAVGDIPMQGGDADRLMKPIMQGSLLVGAVLGGLLLLAKIGFYLWGSVLLTRPRIKRYFGENITLEG